MCVFVCPFFSCLTVFDKLKKGPSRSILIAMEVQEHSALHVSPFTTKSVCTVKLKCVTVFPRHQRQPITFKLLSSHGSFNSLTKGSTVFPGIISLRWLLFTLKSTTGLKQHISISYDVEKHLVKKHLGYIRMTALVSTNQPPQQSQ